MNLLVTIGLDSDLVSRLRAALDARLVAYPALPRLFSLDGQLRVASSSVAGRWLEPRGIIYYGYFDDASAARRAIALAGTPSFPDLAATLPLDDRAMALVLAMRADERVQGRGYVPAGTSLSLGDEHVIKWGHRHCGEDKERVGGSFTCDVDALIEPFVHGRSERILIVGRNEWHLRYESDDWRKNVKPRVEQIEPDAALVARARRTASRLGLVVAGVDYVVSDDSATLLEVNAYPGFEDVPAAVDAFVDLAVEWWGAVTT